MKRSSIELGVGIFVLIGLICVGYLPIKLGKMEWLGPGKDRPGGFQECGPEVRRRRREGVF